MIRSLFRDNLVLSALQQSDSVVSQKSLDNRGGLLSGFERGGTGARGHRNEMVPPGPNRRKPHSRGRGGGHQASGLLTTGGRHTPLDASIVTKCWDTILTTKTRNPAEKSFQEFLNVLARGLVG